MADTMDDSGPFKWPMLVTLYSAMTVGLVMVIAVVLM
jgi:hypothetical protein